MSILDDHPQARSVFAPLLGDAGTKRGNLSHAYLLHGPPGSGRSEVAEFVAVELLKTESGREDTSQRVKSRSHPDLTWITPEGANGEVLVDDIRDRVIAQVPMTPFEARKRVFVIESADRMNESAANAFLKTLEEPPAYVHLILTADSLDSVMPTLRSRCQTVRLAPPGAAVIASRLEADGVDPRLAAECAALAEGDASRARMLASTAGSELRTAGETIAKAALSGGAATATPWVGLLAAAAQLGSDAADEVQSASAQRLEFAAKSERSRIEREAEERSKRARRRAEGTAVDLALFLAESWLRDLQRACLGATDLIADAGRRETLSSAAAATSPARIRAAIELVSRSRRTMGLNVNRELALEALAHRLDGALG